MPAEINDIVNALAVYKAKRAGAFGKVELTDLATGVLGSAISDVQKTTAQLLNGEISRSVAGAEIDRTICATIRSFVGSATSMGIDAVSTYISVQFPVIAPVVFAAKEYVKQKIVLRAQEIAEKGYAWIKEKVGKFLNFLSA